MMQEPSGVGMSVGGAVAYSEVMVFVDERYEVAMVMPSSNAWIR